MGKRGPKPGTGGRPSIDPNRPIDKTLAETIEKLAQMQCTREEIAAVSGVCVDTLRDNENFLQVIKKGMENGKASLRRMQWKSAQDGNVSAQIWLGKNYLGQKDRQELSGDKDNPLQIDASGLLDKLKRMAKK
jgi:hypothetical protein